MAVNPVPDAPAAVVETGNETALVVSDYHAGLETVLQTEGVEVTSRGEQRRLRLLSLLRETVPDRVVVLGDLIHAIGEPWKAEQRELAALFDALDVPTTLVKGNHDGDIEPFLTDGGYDVTVTSSTGIRLGTVGFAHGHTWPSKRVLEAKFVCVGHEHPVVRLEDEVGGHRMERAWLRGQLDDEPFTNHYSDSLDINGELVVFPAFNDLSGGTWVNVPGQKFLSPFLPDGMRDGEAYLLDGTRLGKYRDV